jgi:hypothetical protein
MRARGLTVFASDIQDRGCPDSDVLDFLKMTSRPPGCDVLLSNSPYGEAMAYLEHAWALGFRLVVLLLPPSFLFSAGRFERMHKRGHLRRVHILAERLQDMHDANFTGKKASQSQVHAWFVFDRNYYGNAEINAVSIYRPTERMPWSSSAVCQQCRRAYQPQRSSSRFCSPACRQRAHYRKLGVRLNVRTETILQHQRMTSDGSEEFRYVRHADVARFMEEGWQTPALDRTHHGEQSCRRIKQGSTTP